MKCTATPDSISFVWEGKPYTFRKGMPNFQALKEAIINGNETAIPGLLTVEKAVEQWAEGEFTIQGDAVTYKGEALPANLTKRILEMMTQNKPFKPVLRFWQRLKRNPDSHSVVQLWGFLQHCGIPLTVDGCFLAYKGVRPDYKDCHSGKFVNKPGARFQMPRSEVSSDPNEACHRGFHVGALSYARSFGQRVVIVRVDPEHVVSVPNDESCRKMRVCDYDVVGNFGDKLDDLLEEELPTVEKIPTVVDTLGKAPEVKVETPKDPRLVSLRTDAKCRICGGTIQAGSRALWVTVSSKQGPIHPDCEGKDVAKPSASPVPVKPPKAKVTKVTPPSKPTPATPPKPASSWAEGMLPFTEETWTKLDKMDGAALMDQGIELLRRYASMHLKIVGAYKMVGGRTALIAAIIGARG